MTTWIDFKDLRTRLDFAAVLKHYGIEPSIKGKQHHGFCPLPGHNGQRRSPSFSANLERKIWQCFGCGAKGNVIDFAVRMEGLDPESGEDVRKVALELHRRFIDSTDTPTTPKTKTETVAPPEQALPPPEPVDSRPRKINVPLDFTLKDLDATHSYLPGRGFTAETIEAFGLGYCNRGIMKGRIAIPLHDASGQLIGYAGRLADESAVGAEQPKYRFPSDRERSGTVCEFRKSTFLYNGHRIQKPAPSIVLVEGFPSVWWLHQCGFHNVVAVMGASCSNEQAELLVEMTEANSHIVLLPDGDDAGNRCAESALVRIAPHRLVRWLKLEKGKQPTDLSAEELRALIPES